MIEQPPRLASLQDDDELTSLLVAAASRRRLAHVSVGVLTKGREFIAATDEAFRPRANQDARHQVIRASCLTKPITSTLLGMAVAENEARWTDTVDDVLEVGNRPGVAFSDISMRHLLNHTHGLDGSAIEEVPRTTAGFIDASTLCDQLARLPISPPGQLYSYGSAGTWLAGAALEKLYSRPFRRVLADKLPYLCSYLGDSRLDVICPATGGDLSLSMQSCLAFLKSQMASSPSDIAKGQQRQLRTLLAEKWPLPGWSPAETACCLGWKSYGAGWFGHNANSADESTVVRFNPDLSIAIVVSGAADSAYVALATIFGRSLPEFANFKPPRLLKTAECESLDIGQYEGIYKQARTSIAVAHSTPTTISFSVNDLQSGEVNPPNSLRPAEDHVFLPRLPDSPEFAFIQFVKSNPAARFDYLWNGRMLWRRV